MILTNAYIPLIYIGFALAFLISLILMPILISLSHKLEWLDDPNHRKIHVEPVPRLGGIGLFLALLISIMLAPILTRVFTGEDLTILRKLRLNPLFYVATILIFLIGVLDDFTDTRSLIKLTVQIISSLLVCFGGAVISRISVPIIGISINLAWASWPLTVLWIVGVTNAINLIDGIDGLAATISLIAFFVYGITFMISGQIVLALLSFIVAGSLVGYLFFNFPPAKLFMGDSGSLILGFLLAIFPLISDSANGTKLIMPITLLSIPILDVFFSIARRTRNRRAFSHPDMEHMHHKLIHIGFENRTIIAIVSILMVISGIPILLSNILSVPHIDLFICITWLITGILFMILHWAYHRKIDNNLNNSQGH